MIGIDLGTTNSAVSVVEAGFPILLADASDRRLLPSVVSYCPEKGFSVGHDALSHPANALHSVKSLMGRLDLDLEKHSNARLIDGQVKVMSGGEWFTPVELSAELLRRLKETAEFRTKRAQELAVITVPAYFNEMQRAATVEAAERAGLRVERLIAEPTAAALAYGLERANETTKIAVFDLGGGTFDISILEMRGGFFEVIATAGDTALGGDDFDHVLATILNEDDLLKARAVKHEMSMCGKVVDSVIEEFEAASWSLLDRLRRCCEKVFIDAQLTREEFEKVILVGGSTRMPLIQRFVETIFGTAPDLCLNPDEAVALGAGIQAGILSGELHKMQLLDVTPLSLGIETIGGLMNVIIPRNTTIPCKKGELFTNATEGQSSMKIRVMQGEREFAKDNWQLGLFEIPFQPAPKGQARVGVQFELDESGLLSILVRDTSTNKDTKVVLQQSTVEITNTAVEKMIDESVDHAIDDMEGRVFAENKLKADELLPVLSEAIALCGDQLTEQELASINNAKVQVESAIQEHDGAALKRAVEQLDDATEELAALVMQATLKF